MNPLRPSYLNPPDLCRYYVLAVVRVGAPWRMAKPPEPKPDPSKSPALRVLPMQLQLGDRILDERGEWRVAGRPYTTAAGKTARVRVELAGQPHIHEIRSWAAHERVAVKRE